MLASQFNSFLHPFTALPFSITGAVIALLIGHQSLNIHSMIGTILLVDFTNVRRRGKGLNVRDALLEACPIRLRPILMTSFATVAAAIPPALGIGPGAETRVPMALVVPCAYSPLAPLESTTREKELKEALVELGELKPGGGGEK